MASKNPLYIKGLTFFIPSKHLQIGNINIGLHTWFFVLEYSKNLMIVDALKIRI